MRSKYSPNHLKSPLLHSYFTQSSIFPVIILNRNIKFSPRLHEQTVPLMRIKWCGSSGRQPDRLSTPFPSISLALPVFGPHAQGGCFGGQQLWGPLGPHCCAGRQRRHSGAQWSPFQLYHSMWGGLLVREQDLSWRSVCGSVFRTPGPTGSQEVPR